MIKLDITSYKDVPAAFDYQFKMLCETEEESDELYRILKAIMSDVERHHGNDMVIDNEHISTEEYDIYAMNFAVNDCIKNMSSVQNAVTTIIEKVWG